MASLYELYKANLLERWRKQLDKCSDEQLNQLVVKMVEWFLYTAADDFSSEIPNIVLGTRRGKIHFLLSGNPYLTNGGMIDFLARLYKTEVETNK